MTEWRITNKGGCWPTATQMHLIEAALGNGEAAWSSFQRWKSRQKWDDIDLGTYRLLPLLHWNLRRNGFDDPIMGRMMGIRRRTWVENQTALRTASQLAELFRGAGIDTLLLKGLPLILGCYEELALRPMSDLDLAVPRDHAATAIDLLLGAGWRPQVPSPHRCLAVLPGVAFLHPDDDDIELDLHWDAMAECAGRIGDSGFWRRSSEVTIRDVPARIPSPTDQLLHVCIHGVHYNEVPPIRWIADAACLLRTHPDALCWDIFVAEARARRTTLIVREALAFLSDRLKLESPLKIPSEVRRTLEQTRIGSVERLEYAVRTRGPLGPLGNFPDTVANWVRRTQHQPATTRLRELPSFMRDWWQIDPSDRLVPFVGRKLVGAARRWKGRK